MRIKRILILLCMLLMLTGCFKKDDLDGANIITTVYPIEYLVNSLYGENSTVKSIYPHGIETSTYDLTNKQVKEYANSEMFIYNGLSDEKQLAATFLYQNKALKIIDVSKGLSIKYETDELFISPSNYLMLAQNIKDGLIDYINNKSMQDAIEENYEKIKVLMSEYDAEYRIMAENSNDKVIVVGNDSLRFLENYGIEVISVVENDELTQDTIHRVERLIKEKSISNIFVTVDKETDTIKKLKEAGADVVVIKSLSHLSEKDIKNGIDFEVLMNENMEAIKAELYN